MELYEASVVRYYAEAKDGSGQMDIVSISIIIGAGEFELPYDVAGLVFGIKLEKGERKTFQVPRWIDQPTKLARKNHSR